MINADDFYGADAFRKIYGYLSAAQDDDKYRYCMVGYRVENTLTENGTVSRGVCTVDENGLLDSIIERTAISRQADGRIVYAADGDEPAGEIAGARRYRSTCGGLRLPLWIRWMKGCAAFCRTTAQ